MLDSKMNKRDSHPSGVTSVVTPFFTICDQADADISLQAVKGGLFPVKLIRAEMKDVKGIFKYIKYDTLIVKHSVWNGQNVYYTYKRTWRFLMKNMLVTLLVKGWLCTQVMDVETNPPWQESGSWNGLWSWNDVGGTIGNASVSFCVHMATLTFSGKHVWKVTRV